MDKLLLIFVISFLFLSEMQAADVFVDNSVPSSGDGLSWATAFKNFSDISAWPVGFGPGDTLYISGGPAGGSQTYNLTATIKKLPWNGTPGAGPISVKVGQDSSHNGMVILDGGDTVGPIIDIVNDYNSVIDGEVNGQRQLRIQNWVGSAITGAGSAANRVWKIRYVEIINDDTTCPGGDCTNFVSKHCIVLGSTYAGTTVEYNYLEGCTLESISMGHPNPTAFDTQSVQYNEIKGFKDQLNRGGPDGVKGCGGVTVRYNTIYHVQLENAYYNVSHVAEDGVQVLKDWAKVYNNKIYGYSQGPIRIDMSTDYSHAWIYNNLLYSTHKGGVAPQRGIELDGGGTNNDWTDIKIFNNTFAGFGDLGIRVFVGASTHTDIEIKNNIMFDSAIRVETAAGYDISLLDIDYNLCINGDGSEGSCPAQEHEIWSVSGSFAFDDYTQFSDSSDYHINDDPSGMAVGTGVDLSSYFTTDLDGNTRVWHDIGAYAFRATPRRLFRNVRIGEVEP